MQESERVENRMRRLPERLEEARERGLGRARALGMAAHAVDDDEERRFVVGGDRDPVLVFFAVADEAQVRGLDLQGQLLVFC